MHPLPDRPASLPEFSHAKAVYASDAPDTPRESLGGRTPYDVALENYGIDILKALQLRPIPPDEINLTPKLIRFNH